ncbi:MarR family winged helix-turn-helix transcriptional regulator [Mycobacterium sp. MS1601]|uniref:MarR family winged helix-turn-helix transcriptional regulator n=1 Tax=Mycobacterium sp. MS1601 TaxID=1936029 RepID=UPI0030038B0F
MDGVCADTSRAVEPEFQGGTPKLDVPLSGLDDAEHECWLQFSESAARIGDVLQRALSLEHNFTLCDVMLLQALAKSDDGSARMGDLADALVLMPSRLTQQVSRMEAQGLVIRSTSKHDRRGVVATITHAGRMRLAPALVTYAQIVRTYFLDPVSRRQMLAVGDSCQRISAGFTARSHRAKSVLV